MNKLLQLTPVLASANLVVSESDNIAACLGLIRRSEGRTPRDQGTTAKRTQHH